MPDIAKLEALRRQNFNIIFCQNNRPPLTTHKQLFGWIGNQLEAKKDWSHLGPGRVENHFSKLVEKNSKFLTLATNDRKIFRQVCGTY